MAQVHTFGIDVETHGKAALMRALSRRKGTVSVSDNGKYREDPGYSVVHYKGEMTAEQFETWSYNVKAGQCVVGSFNLL